MAIAKTKRTRRQRQDGLYPYKHPRSGIYYIRGTYLGHAFDHSAGTRDRAVCVELIEARKRQIHDKVINNKGPDRTLAEAAIGYMKGGGERKYLARILTAEIEFEGSRKAFGDMLLKDIDQGMIEDVAAALYPQAKNSTRNRQAHTPISAVLTWASEQRSWNFQHSRVRRPRQPKGRLDWRTPQEIEWWLKRAGHLKGLLTAYVGTGARASEMLNLQWQNVTPQAHRLTLWEDDTKAETARSVELQLRVRAALPERPANNRGHVWLNLKGKRWTNYDVINNALFQITARAAREVASEVERDEIAQCLSLSRTHKVIGLEARAAASKRARDLIVTVAERESIPRIHCHVFRHTWATWAHAVTRDIAWVMAQGGWASTQLAMRYIHVGAADLAEDVLAHGWEMRAGALVRPLALPKPESQTA